VLHVPAKLVLHLGAAGARGQEHGLEPLLETVGIASQILEELEVAVQRAFEPPQPALQILEVFGGCDDDQRVVAPCRRFLQDALPQGRVHRVELRLRRARRQRLDQPPRGISRRDHAKRKRGLEEELAAGSSLGGLEKRRQQELVAGELRVGDERGVDAADRKPELAVEAAGYGEHAPSAVEKHDVAVVEDGAGGNPDDVFEHEQAVLAVVRKARRRDPRERDRGLSELPREQADVREEGTRERQRSGRGEDPPDVVGNGALGEEHGPRDVGGVELHPVTPQGTAGPPRRDRAPLYRKRPGAAGWGRCHGVTHRTAFALPTR
jgi:hypothetical protein